MKPKNFPARKLRRQLVAQGANMSSQDVVDQLTYARGQRTKKRRAG